VATAYIIRYGKPNAAGGPGGTCDVGIPSESYVFSADFGEGAVMLGDGDGALVTGGGSMLELETDARCCMAGSGRAGISSPADVSMVICLVGTVDARSWYSTGEHLTAMEGLLCPGRKATGGLLSPARV
jgi:hypothetical protein